METYTQQKQRHKEEFGKLEGIFFAFSNSQFKEGMEKVGLSENDTHLIYSMGGTGGYIRKDKNQAMKDLLDRQGKEREALKKDKKALVKALVYELNNHEFSYTGDFTDALEALGFTYETIDKSILKQAVKLAYREQQP